MKKYFKIAILTILFSILCFMYYKVFNKIFTDTLAISIMVINTTILTFLFIILIVFIIQIFNIKKRAENISKDDKNKFLYYRDLIKEYSIGELSYIFNGYKRVKYLIAINKYGIYDKNYKDEYEYVNNIKKSLEKKGCIQTKKSNNDFIVLVSSLTLAFCLFTPVIICSLDNISWQTLIACLIIFILYPIMWFFIQSAIDKRNSYTLLTDKGKDIYLKLLGLKRYIKDFTNFDEKELKEIKLYDEYILYAIILNQSKSLSKEILSNMKNRAN